MAVTRRKTGNSTDRAFYLLKTSRHRITQPRAGTITEITQAKKFKGSAALLTALPPGSTVNCPAGNEHCPGGFLPTLARASSEIAIADACTCKRRTRKGDENKENGKVDGKKPKKADDPRRQATRAKAVHARCDAALTRISNKLMLEVYAVEARRVHQLRNITGVQDESTVVVVDTLVSTVVQAAAMLTAAGQMARSLAPILGTDHGICKDKIAHRLLAPPLTSLVLAPLLRPFSAPSPSSPSSAVHRLSPISPTK